ncbi:MAG: transposase [Pseudomonadota bacterium]
MAHMLERIGFIDETWLKTNMAKTMGWVPCGQRLVDHAPFGHWRSQTFVAALRHDRLGAPWVIDGTMNRATFDTYVETQLAPTLRAGDVIILDNLSSHKSARAAEGLRDIGAWFVSRGKPSTGRFYFPSNSCGHIRPISIRTRWLSQSTRR